MRRAFDINIFNNIAKCFLLCLSLLSLPVESIPIQNANTDAGVINEKQILYWLIKRGELESEASLVQQKSAIAAFVGKITRFSNKALIEVKAEKSRHAKQLALEGNKAKSPPFLNIIDSNMEIKVKVLGVLIDFPNLLHGEHGLLTQDTQMHYEDYNRDHYQNLLFSTSGYLGPENQTLISGYQYLQAVSGQSFVFSGEVKDWVTARYDAAYYGSNDERQKDNAVAELVKEAIAQVVSSMSSEELSQYDIEDPYDLDGDGVTDEADGMLDHVMIFHSSIGEEAGGGLLGSDSIWSHRGYVDAYTSGYHLPGTNKKVFGYTIQPIDASLGVCMHEFAHDLGLFDEYNIQHQGKNFSVGAWSLMSAGSSIGKLDGSAPAGLSPYARSYLQQRYLGNWVQEQVVELNEIGGEGFDLALFEAVNHGQLNQISIPLPVEILDFSEPYEGEYQYYSKQGNLLNSAMSFDIELPSVRPLTLSMKAHWNIEEDYDYSQVLVDGVAIAGNLTKASNSVNNARNILTGKSADIVGMAEDDTWIDLTYDLSAYAGRNVRITVNYVTDEAEGSDGIIIDNIAVNQGDNEIYLDGAELDGQMSLVGFERVSNQISGENQRYIIQLRNYNGVDVGLSSVDYEAGVLLWLENSHFDRGPSIIGVVDADQNLIIKGSTDIQLRDAAFSLFNQGRYFGDEHLASINRFDDNQDYSAPLQPRSGILLPEIGLSFEIVEQADNHDKVIVSLRYDKAE
ncbi:immune inhibitor A domain-containing protein [Shewanella surugensis]|uniref:Immune inhibitor A n=1 Tax=Shewanella surugensis TaxID=212020 RepID=A0ABT0L8L7_9GAMM|nr:immune inhibitor A domain-containing protein [Shewanella surugensis]MCL1124037.1 immune inhibitor A [Shewanella surugensis]